MNHTPCVALGLTLLSQPLLAAEGGFFEDSKATLSARNYYFSRDFSDIVGANKQSKAEEWAQGFILDFKSGYTPGTVGFGVDALGLLGIKLDSSPDRANTGLLPVHGDGRLDRACPPAGLASTPASGGPTSGGAGGRPRRSGRASGSRAGQETIRGMRTPPSPNMYL